MKHRVVCLAFSILAYQQHLMMMIIITTLITVYRSTQTVHTIKTSDPDLRHGSCPDVKIKFKDFSRTIQRVFKENYINPKQHFYKII